MTIHGPGRDVINVSGGDNVRVFWINGARPCNFTVNIDSLEISHGTAATGGGIYSTGNLNVSFCRIDTNHASGNGGGIANYGNLNVGGTEVTWNTADGDGGGIWNFADSAAVTSCPITYNTAGGSGGGIWNSGVGFTITGGDTDIKANMATTAGGGIYERSTGSMTMTGGKLDYNSAESGGGFYADGGQNTISSVNIYNNNAYASVGGGFYVGGGTTTFSSCTFSFNEAAGVGSGGYWSANATVTNSNNSCTNWNGGEPFQDMVQGN